LTRTRRIGKEQGTHLVRIEPAPEGWLRIESEGPGLPAGANELNEGT